MIRLILPLLLLLNITGASAGRFVYLPPAAEIPNALTDCGTGKCVPATEGKFAGPWVSVLDTDSDGDSNMLDLPPSERYDRYQACYGINIDFTGYVWVRARGQGAIWVNDDYHGADGLPPKNIYHSKIDSPDNFTFVPIGLRADEDFKRDLIAADTPQRQFTFDGSPTPTKLCIMMSPGVRLRSIYLNTSSTATPALPTTEAPAPLVQYTFFELGANPEPTVDSTLWDQANNVVFSGFQDVAPTAPVFVKGVWKEGTPDRLCVRSEKTLANQDWVDVSTDSTSIPNYTSLIAYLKTANTTRVLDGTTWLLGVSPQPDYYDANWTDGTFTATPDLANVSVTSSVSGDRRRMQACFDAPDALAANQQFVCDFRFNERVVGGTRRYQYAFNPVDAASNIGGWGLCVAGGSIPAPPADTTAPTVSNTTVNCTSPSSCTVTVTGSDNASATMTSTVQIGTSTGVYTSTNGPITTVGTCTSSCSATHTFSGLSASTQYFFLGTLRDSSGNTDDGSETTGTTQAAGATFYVATNGNNANACSNAAPCLLSKLDDASEPKPSPGETWLVKNGTYTSGFPIINCAAGSSNGTASQPITIRAENERQALLSSNGSVTPLWLRNCSHWVIQGLRIRSADLDLTSGSGGDPVWLETSHHITFKRNVVHNNNRYTNSHLLGLEETTNSLIEDNEFYLFHRKAIFLRFANSNTIRRNYFHARGHNNISGGYPSGGSEGISIYPGSDNILENNISEGVTSAGFNIEAYSVGADRNQFLGNISLNDKRGILFKARGSSSTLMPKDNVVKDQVIVTPTLQGVYLRGNKNTQLTNFSIIGGANGFLADREEAYPGDGRYSVFVDNSLASATSGTGFRVSSSAGTWTWNVDYPNAHANATNFSPSATDPNITNERTVDPLFGTTRVCVPEASPLKGTGAGGADVGANVLYRYTNGSLTSTKLWTQSKPASCPANTSGWYLSGMGECIAGVNDSLSTSLVGLADRLGITTTSLNNCVPGTYASAPIRQMPLTLHAYQWIVDADR